VQKVFASVGSNIVTIDNVLTDILYNDLGIMAGDHKLLLLLEA